MEDLGVAAQTAMAFAMLLQVLLAASVATPARPSARESEDGLEQLLGRTELPSVTTLGELALHLQRYPMPTVPDPRGLMQLPQKMEQRMPGLVLSPGLVRLEGLGAAADTAEGLVYAALLWLATALRCAAHAKNRAVFGLLVVAVLYPALEVLHDEQLGASDLDRQHKSGVKLARDAAIKALLRPEAAADGPLKALMRALRVVAVKLEGMSQEEDRSGTELASKTVEDGLDTIRQLSLL
jgi:hypothetical protein